MELVRWFDRTLLNFLTDLGGTASVRDNIVFIIANVLPFVLIIAGVWLFFTGRTQRQREINRETTLIAVGATLLAIGIRALLAGAFARPRPYITYPHIEHLDPAPIFWGGSPNASYSFPSGHMFEMFAFAGTVYFIGKHPRLAWALLGVCILTGLARIAAGYHYPTDIVGGALLGLALAKLLSLQSSWARKQVR
jgi:membrane-associated phospholipid phosphatase